MDGRVGTIEQDVGLNREGPSQSEAHQQEGGDAGADPDAARPRVGAARGDGGEGGEQQPADSGRQDRLVPVQEIETDRPGGQGGDEDHGNLGRGSEFATLEHRETPRPGEGQRQEDQGAGDEHQEGGDIGLGKEEAPGADDQRAGQQPDDPL